MTTAFILASGPSMTQKTADAVRGKGLVIAVSNCYTLAPWADALVSMDARWWRHYKPEFAGRKFCGFESHDTERVEGVLSGWNSGLLGIKVAVDLGATRIVLLGFDMQGTHYFGKHPEPLRNTHTQRFEAFKIQFRDYRPPKGVQIINATTGSALKCFPAANLEELLCEPGSIYATP